MPLYVSVRKVGFIVIEYSLVIWVGLGPKFMAAQYAGLKTQACQRNLSAIYTGRNQNSIINIARVLVGLWLDYFTPDSPLNMYQNNFRF